MRTRFPTHLSINLGGGFSLALKVAIGEALVRLGHLALGDCRVSMCVPWELPSGAAAKERGEKDKVGRKGGNVLLWEATAA